MSIVKTLYEDNHLIAVLKPAGILTQGDKTGDISLFDEVKNYIKENKNKKTPSNPSGQAGKVFLGLLHRIDRPVSGIILFAKTSKGASRLSGQFRNRTIEKTYYAIVLGKLKDNKGVLKNNLIKDKKLKKARVKSVCQSTLGMSRGLSEQIGESHLYYEVVKFNDEYSLLKIKIDTGKFHQIRVQLAAAGFPIFGDVKYGGQKWHNPKTIALCAAELSFMTATNEKRIHLKVGLPEEWRRYIKYVNLSTA